MKISRRNALLAGLAGTGLGASGLITNRLFAKPENGISTASQVPATHAIIPVVSDGHYILDKPPADTEGYFFPRDYEVKVGMSFTANANSTNLTATTAAPVSFPEQEILEFEIEADGCQAEIIQLTETAAVLALSTGRIAAGQTVFAIAHYKMRVCMEYRAFEKERFPAEQNGAEKIFSKSVLRNGTGIRCNTKVVRDVVNEVIPQGTHPWDAAKIFHEWVFDHIKGVPCDYTSVEEAIQKGQGDCEERASVFIALCRAAGIPARLVWVPGHNWAEIGLIDQEGQPFWIPVHTAAYSWFGWTGVHEVVLQKGDNIYVKHRKKAFRLLDDWYRVEGPHLTALFKAGIIPQSTIRDDDPGPGQREKMANGVWELTGEHPKNEYMRDK